MNEGALGFPGRFESPLMPLPSAGADINRRVFHGKGKVPRDVRWVLVCLQTNLGYATGDEIDAVSGYNNGVQPTVWSSASQCGIILDSGHALDYHNKETSAFTNLSNVNRNWALKCYASW